MTTTVALTWIKGRYAEDRLTGNDIGFVDATTLMLGELQQRQSAKCSVLHDAACAAACVCILAKAGNPGWQEPGTAHTCTSSELNLHTLQPLYCLLHQPCQLLPNDTDNSIRTCTWIPAAELLSLAAAAHAFQRTTHLQNLDAQQPMIPPTCTSISAAELPSLAAAARAFRTASHAHSKLSSRLLTSNSACKTRQHVETEITQILLLLLHFRL